MKHPQTRKNVVEVIEEAPSLTEVEPKVKPTKTKPKPKTVRKKKTTKVE